MKKVISFFLLMLTIISCNTRNELDAGSYVRFFEQRDTHCTRYIDAGKTGYCFRLLTPEYFSLREGARTGNMDKAVFQKRLQEIASNTYFIIEVKNNTPDDANQDPEAKARVIRYYQTLVKNRIHLLTATGTVLSPSYVNYEDNYGLSPANNLFVCFDHNMKDGAAVKLTYDDELNKNPDLTAAFSASEIKELPTLKF